MSILFIGYLIIGLVYATGMLVTGIIVKDKELNILTVFEYWCDWLAWPIGLIECIIELNK